MQNQIDQKYREPSRKRAMHNDYSFKSKGNSLQFKFNSGLQGDIEDILDEQNLHESNVETFNAIVSKISKRNKLIKIANVLWQDGQLLLNTRTILLQAIRKILRKFGKLKIEA